MLLWNASNPLNRSLDLQEIARFLRNPRKPVILAMSRPDAKKNITTLVKAFGENNTLREIANLVLVMVRFAARAYAVCLHFLRSCKRSAEAVGCRAVSMAS